MSALLIVLSMTIFTYHVAEKESETLAKELQEEAVAVADNLAASTASYIIVKDYTSLESVLVRAAQFPSILDIQAINDDGLLLGDVYRDSTGEVLVRYDTTAATPPTEMDRHIKTKDGLLTVWQPVILGDLVGWIRTRYTLNRITEVKAQIWQHNVLIGAIVAIIAVLIYSLGLRKPLHLIEQNTAFADELDEHAGRQIPVNHSYAELSRLTSALNRTSKNLQAKNEALNQKIREQQDLTDELELRVLERTSELSDARDEAIHANRSKSEFLANMSHEIRTPLTAVIGFAESLLDTSHTMEERVDFINRIIQAGNHLLRIINEILDLSKIEANQFEIESIPFSLVDLLRDIYSLVKLQATGKGLCFKVTCDVPMPALIESDPVRLKQILLNLCNNAIKFTKEGIVSVRLSCDVGAEKIIIKVIDTGIGLSPEQIAKLFKPFSQADSSTTRKYGGTGLGLHLSKQLAEKLGGSLSVQSMPDIGSCFTVTISTGSLRDADMLTTCPDFEHIDTLQKAIPKQLRFVGRILLTEDNQDNQRLMSILLKRMGIEYEIANHGKEALAMVENGNYDVIFMDVQMPVMDGITATQLLRKQGYAGPIVALTANAMKQEQQECFDAGCNDVCTKPIDQVALGRVLSKYLVTALPKNGDGPPIVSSLLASEPDLADLIREFVKKLPEMVNKIKLAYTEKQMDDLRREVHTVKGTGGNFGYAEVFELAKRIEFEIIAGNTFAAGELIDALESIVNRVEQGLVLMANEDTEVQKKPLNG